jgi:hypothetical protein
MIRDTKPQLGEIQVATVTRKVEGKRKDEKVR